MSEFFRKYGLIIQKCFDYGKEARISEKIFHNRVKNIHLPKNV